MSFGARDVEAINEIYRSSTNPSLHPARANCGVVISGNKKSGLCPRAAAYHWAALVEFPVPQREHDHVRQPTVRRGLDQLGAREMAVNVETAFQQIERSGVRQ